jgi:peptidoglycan/LPS O-acetylase OafA/YrhL
MKRLDQLTFTRFLAVFLVLVYHGSAGIYIRPIKFFPISALLYSAPTAVSYLYVLSGFVMSLVYYRPQERFDVRGYWSARFVRIYPLYIISFLLVCLYYFEYMARIEVRKILANVFLLQAWFPDYAQSFNYASWSLTVEFFFYSLLPFFTMWAYHQSMRKLIWVSIGLWGLSQSVHYFLWMRLYPGQEHFIVYFPIFHLNSFILGVVGGIWFLRESSAHVVKPLVNFLLLGGSIIFVCLFIIAGAVSPRIPHDLQPMAGLLSPFFVLIIVTLALDKSRLSGILNHPWLVLLGETAYALYILEVPIRWFYERALETFSLGNPRHVLEMSSLPLLISVGLLAHLYVDQPLRRGLKKLLKRVSIPLLLLDLASVAISIYLGFLIRFGAGRELQEFISTAYLMFWIAFVVRIFVPIIFNASNPSVLFMPASQMIRRVVFAVSAGSLVIAVLMWLAFAANWTPGFPRSVFLLDWGFMIIFSSLLRFIFRTIGLYKEKVVLS